MKIFKLLGLFLFFVILVTLIISLILPVYQEVSRSTTVNAPANIVYDQLSRLENFNRLSPWNEEDSLTEFRHSGKDGTVGAKTHWKGHEMIQGEGTITIKELIPGKKLVHQIDFVKPKKGKADSQIDLHSSGNVTDVKWTFRLHTPRPWNIFNLFYDLEEERGETFEDGLKLLKALIEKNK